MNVVLQEAWFYNSLLHTPNLSFIFVFFLFLPFSSFFLFLNFLSSRLDKLDFIVKNKPSYQIVFGQMVYDIRHTLAKAGPTRAWHGTTSIQGKKYNIFHFFNLHHRPLFLLDNHARKLIGHNLLHLHLSLLGNRKLNFGK